MEDTQKYPIASRNSDSEKRPLLAYHYSVGDTTIKFYGMLIKRRDSQRRVKQPQKPTSTEWKTTKGSRIKELLERFVSKVSKVPHIARVEYEKKG